jgi:hypothetical protein
LHHSNFSFDNDLEVTCCPESARAHLSAHTPRPKPHSSTINTTFYLLAVLGFVLAIGARPRDESVGTGKTRVYTRLAEVLATRDPAALEIARATK